MDRLSFWPIRQVTLCGLLGLPLLMLSLCGCVSSSSHSSPPPGDTLDAADYGSALLFDLLGDEKDVSKLLLIKRERAELRNLIKEISQRCASAHKELEAFAKADKQLNLKDRGLPTAESKTRESISKARGKQLLGDKGKEFELHLLLTQNEALTYGAHLAGVLAAREPNSARARFFQELSHSLGQLQERVVAMLLSNYSWPTAK